MNKNTDYLALAELAKAVLDHRVENMGDISAQTMAGMRKLMAFQAAASPDVVLVLVADNTRLAAENELAQSNLGKYMAAATELQAQLDALQAQEHVAKVRPWGVEWVKSCGGGNKTREGMLLFAAAGAQPAAQPVGINGLTDAETDASMSVRGLSKPTVKESLIDRLRQASDNTFRGDLCRQAADALAQSVNQELLAALTHAVEIAESKRDGTWDDLLQYRAAITKAERNKNA